MFGSQILEVGIGLIMVFLLVSLILTAVRETIESWTKTRSRDLERAIAELLDDHTGTGLRKQLYKHPLVYGLFQGPVRLTDFSKGTTSGAPAAAARTKAAAEGDPPADDPTKLAEAGAGGATPDEEEEEERTDATRLPSYIPRETFAVALEHLLNSGQASGKIAEAYAALSRVANGKPELVRKGLEEWYDAAMDRASGWYRRRTQTILFWLGLAVAIALNINAFTIAQYLSTSSAAREQVVALGDAYLKDEAVIAALRTPEAASTDEAQGNVAAGENAQAADNQAAANVTEESETGDEGAADNEADSANESIEANSSATAQGSEKGGKKLTKADVTRKLQGDLAEIGIPIGWNAVQWGRFKDQLTNHGCVAGIGFALMLLAGYLAVAFAATMGAPFWFDLLGKFMVIRSTVKPKEKSPDEASKDGGTGGAPVTRKGATGTVEGQEAGQ
jgi:hypothetical protein